MKRRYFLSGAAALAGSLTWGRPAHAFLLQKLLLTAEHGASSAGNLFSWGYNSVGQLGLGDIVNRSSPVQVGTSRNWAQISCSEEHVLAITSDGKLYSWGENQWGQLGHGNSGGGTNLSSPVQVGALTNWATCAAGYGHSLAITTNGELFSWGYNRGGQLGQGNSGPGTYLSSPVQVGALTTWASIAAGSNFAAAISASGALYTWGINTSGQLGLGDVINRSSPVQVGVSLWASIAAGAYHCLATATNGALFSWGGKNAYGELGNGASSGLIYYKSPIQIGALTTWSNVSAGRYVSSALSAGGTLLTWGKNNKGQLGLGDVINRSSPVQVGALTTWTKIDCHAASHMQGIHT